MSGTCAAPAAIRADRHDGLEAYVEEVVCRELDRRARCYVEVSDSAAMAAAVAELDDARDDLESMRRDTAARRRLGPRWLSFVEPLVEAVEVAERRVAELSDLRASPGLSGPGLTADAYRSLRREERAAVLGAMIGCVFARKVGGPRGPQAIPVDERRVRILWRGQAPTDLPAHNKASAVSPWRGFEDEPPAGVATS